MYDECFTSPRSISNTRITVVLLAVSVVVVVAVAMISSITIHARHLLVNPICVTRLLLKLCVVIAFEQSEPAFVVLRSS